jgi:hypothetical protein
VDKDEKGKSTVSKLGMAPDQRKDMEYEFTIFFDLDSNHFAKSTKDRTNMYDGKYFIITPKTGVEIMEWLQGSTHNPDKIIATTIVRKAHPVEAVQELRNTIISTCIRLGGQKNPGLMEVVKKYIPNGNPNSVKDVDGPNPVSAVKVLSDLKVALEDFEALSAKEPATA